jgi:hypothetical protein
MVVAVSRSMKYLVLVTFVTACFDAPELELAELPDLRVSVGGSPERLQVTLQRFAEEIFDREGCWQVADGFEARVGDRELAILNPGTFDGEDCFEPVLELAGPDPTPDATLSLADGSKTISVPLGNMLVPRVAELSPAGPWELSPGQSVYATLVPGIDLPAHNVFVAFLPTAGERVSTYSFASGDRVTFEIPEKVTPQQGQLEMTLNEWPARIACEGAVCVRAQRQTWLQPVTIVPPFAAAP